MIEDLQSTNGTRVGDERLTGARLLVSGDVIEIGSTLLVFESDPIVLSSVDASHQSDVQIARVRPEDKLESILELIRALDGTIELNGVLEKVLDTLFRILPQAERGFILLTKYSMGELIPKARSIPEAAGGYISGVQSHDLQPR